MAPAPSHRGRTLGSRVAIVVATVALLVALVGTWVDRTVLDAKTFAARTVAILDSDAIRTEIAETLADQVTAAEPRLIQYRPLLVTILDGVLTTDRMHTAIRAALEETHRIAVEGKAGTDVINLAATLSLARTSLAIAAPDAADLFPTDPNVFVVELEEQGRALGLADLAWNVRWLAFLSSAIAIGAYATAFVLARDRRRMTVYAGAGGIVVGLVIVLLARVARGYVSGSIADPFASRAAGEIVDRFTGDLRALGYWVLAYATLAVAVAAVPRSFAHRAAPVALITGYARRAAQLPRTAAGRVSRAVALILSGVALLLWPSALLAVAGALLGATVLFVGVVELIAVLGREPAPARDASSPRAEAAVASRHRRTRAVVAVGVVTLAGVTLGGVLNVRSAASAARAGDDRRCNGHEELCDRRLDTVTFAGTHNSMAAAAEPGWFFPANRYGIADQLTFGIRAFLIDVYYGVPSTVSAPGTQTPLILSDRGTTLANGLRFGGDRERPFGDADLEAQANQLASAAARPTGATPALYLCHAWCELGATPLADALETLAAFLDANPSEVVIVVVEDYVTGTDLEDQFRSADLLPHVRTLEPREPLPTLGEMIDDGRNLVVVAEQGGPPPSWFHSYGSVLQDTPFYARTVDEMSCDFARGSRRAPLFLVNHWLTTGTHTPETGRAANAREVLLPRAEHCRDERGLQPTILAVDWYDEGDLLAVVDTLNGVD